MYFGFQFCNYFCNSYFQNVEKLTHFQRFPPLFFSPGIFSGSYKFRMLLCIPSSLAQILPPVPSFWVYLGYSSFPYGQCNSIKQQSSTVSFLFFFNVKPRELIVHLCVIIDSIKPYGLVRLSNILNSTLFFTGNTFDN